MLQSKKKSYEVFYRDQKVGILAENPDGFSCFSYEENWIRNGFSISPIFLPLSSSLFVQSPKRAYFGGLFGVFYDCLPDSWGNILVDRYLASKGIHPGSLSLFQRLALLDSYSLGGLSFRPSESSFSSLSFSIEEIAKGFSAISDNETISDKELLEAYHAGSSTGGSHMKANMLIDGELWIVKFPTKKLDIKNAAEIEYQYNLAAKECGIPLPEFRHIPSKNGGGYFASKRFDRDEEGKPIHMISLAGLLETNIAFPMLDYLSFLQTCKLFCPMDLETAYKMMCFNVFAKNKDDHARNFSFLYSEKEESYRLSPFYDITYTPYILEHALGVNRKGNPSKEDMLLVGKKVGLSLDWQKKVQAEIEEIVESRLSKYWQKENI